MPKKSFPEFVPPMMAESANAPFDASDWIFEIKLDGYRAITVFDSGRQASPLVMQRLATRTEIPVDRQRRIKLKLRSTILDGEIVAVEQLRQTTFLGWRDDKKPKEIVLERY